MNEWRQSMSTVTFGLSLVCVMSAVLFVLTGLNAKDPEFGNLPWIYSGVSAVGAVVLYLVSRRLERPQA